ncbi:polysaccharide biosynthesis/export family protein [Chondrinema litorale]|uniref:polysaccharide biosynthesis/export family protein n=1 Tax=Chondrinema litorale TaxID=2994555 RepID=UPI002544A8AB|nr:polysaccharide biosynthesis/export family protein [Chondrinema litorale]UZR92831.1 polysaccharide biosynthesis/export family protein [Chondrinema litorale]
MRRYCWLAWLILLSACISQDRLIYLNGDIDQTFENYPTPEYRIRPLDILHIDLNNFSGSTTDYLRGGVENSMSQQGLSQGNPAYFYFKGFVVNDSGSINLPLVGTLNVAGLTTYEIETLVNKKLKEDYLQYPSVNVKLANFRVSVLGEVQQPGVQYVYDKQYTLLQAISQARDLTEYGNREKVKLVRKNEVNTEIFIIDLTNPELISSDKFFLQPNDVIYIEPVKAKAFSVNSRVASLGLSIISIVLVIINLSK